MEKAGLRLLRWSVLGLIVAWVTYFVLILTSAEADGVAADIAWTAALRAPTAWAYVRPGLASGAVALIVAWPSAALTVAGMFVLPVIVIAEVTIALARVRRDDRLVNDSHSPSKRRYGAMNGSGDNSCAQHRLRCRPVTP